jgi:hypothetical protein
MNPPHLPINPHFLFKCICVYFGVLTTSGIAKLHEQNDIQIELLKTLTRKVR